MAKRQKQREVDPALLAPAPITDRYPVIIGQNLTLTYLANTYRLATQGIRHPFVDAISELLEHDPHARGVVRQRVLTVAGARLEILPALLPSGHPEERRAREIAGECDGQIRRIPRLTQSMGALAWGAIYGISGSEIEWERKDKWVATGIHFLHSRRLSYPNPNTWDLHVWDQGALGFGALPGAVGISGLRIDDFPGKFIIHTPQLSGDYPTRDGEARYIGTYLALKRTVVRASAQDFERTIRPWVLGYFNREADKNARTVAQKEDIEQLKAAVKALGLGSLSGAVLPDACKVELLRAASTANAQEFVEFLDAQVTKAMLGQTFTTEPGKYGSKGVSDVAKCGSLDLARYDAQCLADSLQASLVHWIVRLNYPSEIHLCPRVVIAVDDEPDPETLMKLAADADAIGMPLDYVELGRRARLPLDPAARGRRKRKARPDRKRDEGDADGVTPA